MPSPANDKKRIVAEVPKACQDEAYAVAFLEKQRWCDEPACPRCESDNVYQMKNRKTGEREKHFRWRCRSCKKQFSVRTGTVFEDSRIPLKYWCWAFWRACSSKKGISALQVKRETGLTYKTALFLMHRIRWAMAEVPTDQLRGIVEVDETYVGGKPRAGKMPRRRAIYRNRPELGDRAWKGRGPDFEERKTPVMALVERGGRARARVPRFPVTAGNLKRVVREEVARSARIMTDEHRGYQGLSREYAGHETVKHSAREYARGHVYTNTVEGFFALLKRAIYGTHHHVSRKHLHRYVSEAAFRYNTRKTDDGGRLQAAIQASQGKRLRFYGSP